MIKILTLVLLTIAFLTLVSAPYISALLYAGVSLLQPQFVWFWAFDGIPIFNISAGLAIIAWIISVGRKQVDLSVYNNGIFYGMLILLIMFHLSDLLSPFPNYASSVSSDIVLNVYNTIFIMFVVTLGLINHQKALKLLIFVLVLVILYYTWWANSNYLQSNWSQFVSGRLEGPRGSPYRDGNGFSILYIIGLPFLMFGVYYVKHKWQKAILILAIPLLWHALILYASRGAILSASVSTLFAAWIIRSKAFNVILLIGFVLFIVDQGANVINRASETVQLAESGADGPINPRIVSWQTGLELVVQHPLFGVGPQRFLEASAFYSPGKTPHVAHNTFLNFSANTGLLAGITYLSFFWVSRKMYKWNKQALEENPDKLHEYINRASITALIGFFVGAIFLDLIIFEPFYFLLLVIVANHFVLKKRVLATTSVDIDIKTNVPISTGRAHSSYGQQFK